MSTHAVLGVKHPNGTIDGCYVHYDGSTMLPRITDYVSENTTTGLTILIVQAQLKGGMRSFHCPPPFIPAAAPEDCAPVTDFLDDNRPYVINETDFYEDHMGTYAWYLVDYTTGQIEERLYYENR